MQSMPVIGAHALTLTSFFSRKLHCNSSINLAAYRSFQVRNSLITRLVNSSF